MRVSLSVAIAAVGILALAGCGPSRYDYGYDYEEFEREERYEPPQRAKSRKSNVRKSRTVEARRRSASTAAPGPRRTEREETAKQEPRSEDASTAARGGVFEAPSSTPPEAQAAAAPEPPAAASPTAATAASDEASRKVAQKQIEDGYRLLRAGFVKKAREKFDQAMKVNSAEASLGQGRSMDPTYLKTVAFPDVIPDAEQARRIYRRAVMLGNGEAKNDLDRLEKALAAAQPAGQAPSNEQLQPAQPPAGSSSPIPPANAAPAAPAESQK